MLEYAPPGKSPKPMKKGGWAAARAGTRSGARVMAMRMRDGRRRTCGDHTQSCEEPPANGRCHKPSFRRTRDMEAFSPSSNQPDQHTPVVGPRVRVHSTTNRAAECMRGRIVLGMIGQGWSLALSRESRRGAPRQITCRGAPLDRHSQVTPFFLIRSAETADAASSAETTDAPSSAATLAPVVRGQGPEANVNPRRFCPGRQRASTCRRDERAPVRRRTRRLFRRLRR